MGSAQTKYQKGIKSRSSIRYLKGVIPRYLSYLKNGYIVWLARQRGAVIGECVTMPYRLAKKANKNLEIGSHTAIGTVHLDLRARIIIGSHVIIGADVEILTVSHDVDSKDWEYKTYGITIEDYCWLATRAFILPSCRKIKHGAICAAGSVVANNIEAMEIVAGNPAKLLRIRKQAHTDLCVESLLGNDYLAYVEAYKQ
jgi:acetyltransferase-like isoleucine patch superfamily enzyme